MENVGRSSVRGLEIVFRERVPRAQRYEINTAMRYRLRGEKLWREGVVKNISISGVLIRIDQFLDLEATIEVRFSLPIHLRGERPAEVLCRGFVIRSLKCEEPNRAVMVAAKIEHWRFLRKKGRESEQPEYLSKGPFLKIE
jgi:PilZ domain